MERSEMIDRATKLAKEKIEEVSACNDSQYERLQKLPDEQAVRTLVMDILQDALTTVEDDL